MKNSIKVYIAAPYKKKIGQIVSENLSEKNIDHFLPKSINVDARTPEEQKYVGDTCYTELDQCEIIVCIYPFGLSVAAEVGYAIDQKIRSHMNKTLILLDLEDKSCEDFLQSKICGEDMIMPYIDKIVFSIEELMKELVNIIQKT